MTRQTPNPSTRESPTNSTQADQSLSEAMGQLTDGPSATADTAITSLIGREVYTKSGVFVGEVEDLKLDFHNQRATRLVLDYINEEVIDTPRGKSGVLVPYRWVQSVGDIILVADFVENLNRQEDAP